MKARESGMPEEGYWAGFFNPENILEKMGINGKIKDVADFGCGYGTFSIPVAKLVSGKVYAIDIESEMIEITKRKAEENGLDNIEIILRDFISNGSGLNDENVDYAMLFNILHAEEPEKLLREAYRILRKDGKLGIIHWNYDPTTPRGPSMEIRPKPEQCIEWAESVGFEFQQTYNLKPYHYGIMMQK
jgi:ubiquinone/menaquinone biosynthesis C-methylase UbiE